MHTHRRWLVSALTAGLGPTPPLPWSRARKGRTQAMDLARLPARRESVFATEEAFLRGLFATRPSFSEKSKTIDEMTAHWFQNGVDRGRTLTTGLGTVTF